MDFYYTSIDCKLFLFELWEKNIDIDITYLCDN